MFLDAAVPDDGMSLWDLFGGTQQDPSRFADGFMQVPWVKPGTPPPHSVKHKSWQRAIARGWTIRTFPGGHVAHQEDPRGVATLIEHSVNDRNKAPAKAAK